MGCTSQTLAAVSLTLVGGYLYHRLKVNQVTKMWQERRQEERTGRIRAETKLRTLSKQQSRKEGTATVNIIGTVVSPYTKRMGTPRQPQLVPSSRALIEFNVPATSLEGIDAYSHVWVIFEFHANTNSDTQKKTKIRPPRGGGIKVGQLATRSPHRPNPIGLSLVQLERYEPQTRSLYISGCDLVNGTPVYDIKPYVPWDIPGYPRYNVSSEVLRFPDWVAQDDSMETVEWSTVAEQNLRQTVLSGYWAPLYTAANDGVAAARATVQEILAQDPRSSHRGLKQNARGTSSSETYRMILCKCEIEFVNQNGRMHVLNVAPVDFDDSQYIEGVPLVKL